MRHASEPTVFAATLIFINIFEITYKKYTTSLKLAVHYGESVRVYTKKIQRILLNRGKIGNS